MSDGITSAASSRNLPLSSLASRGLFISHDRRPGGKLSRATRPLSGEVNKPRSSAFLLHLLSLLSDAFVSLNEPVHFPFV